MVIVTLGLSLSATAGTEVFWEGRIENSHPLTPCGAMMILMDRNGDTGWRGWCETWAGKWWGAERKVEIQNFGSGGGRSNWNVGEGRTTPEMNEREDGWEHCGARNYVKVEKKVCGSKECWCCIPAPGDGNRVVTNKGGRSVHGVTKHSRHCQLQQPGLRGSSQTPLLAPFLVLPWVIPSQLGTASTGLSCSGPVWIGSACQRALGFASRL